MVDTLKVLINPIIGYKKMSVNQTQEANKKKKTIQY